MAAHTYFNKEQLGEIRHAYDSASEKYHRLILLYTAFSFTTSRAREYAIHGFSRRLKTLVRCIERTFEIIPPHREDKPSRDELTDTAIYIQAFIFNVFGSLDNLAWIWVAEKNIKTERGKPLAAQSVGLGKKNELVRRSLSDEFRNELEEFSAWFDHIDDYRHALAHRIPLYIPPYRVRPSDERAFRDLTDKMLDAQRRRDYAEYDRLNAEQDALGEFRPVIIHSYEERANPVPFHTQMLADYNTVVEIGEMMLKELIR